MDFPEPLGPTTAQLCPGSTFRLTPFSTGRPGWYLQRSRGLRCSSTICSEAWCTCADLVLQTDTARDKAQPGQDVAAYPNSTFLSSMDTPTFLPEVLASMAPFLHGSLSLLSIRLTEMSIATGGCVFKLTDTKPASGLQQDV